MCVVCCKGGNNKVVKKKRKNIYIISFNLIKCLRNEMCVE
jgi:hypothetical protein